MLKISLAGCGGIAEVHGQIICQSNNAVFLSCCDEKPERATVFADRFGCKAYTNLKNLIDAEKPDILHICAPHYTHVPLALYALKKGVHVFLEKPAASSPSDINVLIDAQKKYQKQVAVCFQNRYNSSSAYVKKLLDSREAGKVLGARAFVTWHRESPYYEQSDWRGSLNTEGRSILLNQSIHTVDLLYWLLGMPAKTEGTVSNHFHKGLINTEDTVEACFFYKNGMRALFYASLGYCTDAPVRIELTCEKLIIDLQPDSVSITHRDSGKVESPELTIPILCNNAIMGKSYWGLSHALIIEDFYQHIIQNKPFFLNSEEGCKSLEMCFDIINSSNK